MVLLFTSLYLTKDLHFTINQAGMALSCYGVGSILGSYSGGWLTDKRNFRSIMINSLFISGLILLNLLWVRSPLMVSLVIFLYAFTSDMFRPANSKAIAVYSDPENRTRSVSLVRLAINLGFAVGPAGGGFIALLLGYRWLFVIDALTSMAAALMLVLYLPTRSSIPTQEQRKADDPKSLSAYRDVPYLIFIGLVAIYGMGFFQLFASIPQFYSREWHYSEDTIGLLMALNGLLVVVVEMPLVAFLEKHRHPGRYIIAGALCIPLSFLFLIFGNPTVGMAVGFTVLITFAEILAMPFMMNFSLSRPAKERQGQYSALYSISFGISNTVAPIVGLGIAHHAGFPVMFLVFISTSMLAAVGFFFLFRKINRNS